MKHKLGSYLLASLLPVAFGISPVFAAQLKNSEHSVTVIPAEGNGVCSDYGANDFIKEMGSKISCPGDHGTWMPVSGPDGGEALWKYDCDTNELSFRESTVPINYTVTKASRNVTWYPYGSGTWKADSRITNQDANSTGDYAAVLEMASFALCYGLPASDNAVEPAAFESCTNLGDNTNDAWLDIIDCGDLADGTVVTLWQPPTVEGADDSFYQCVCNDTDTVETVDCDPTGDSGDLRPCYTKDMGQFKATTVVEFDADPVVCTTSGGTRTCKWVAPLW